MKKLIFIFILSVASLQVFSQMMEWTVPVPVTDSLSDNINVSLPEITTYWGDSLFMVWEKPGAPGETAIWCRNLETMGEPFVLLSQPGVQYKHPVIIGNQSGDTLIYVLYETNVNGNWDIYYIKYLKNGTVTAPVAVCNSTMDERNFNYSGYSSELVWEQNDSILLKRPVLVSPVPYATFVIDHGNCHHPVIGSEFCNWEKVIGNDTVIMQSEYDFSGGTWSLPTQLIGGVNQHLSRSSGFSQIMVWQAREGSYWRVKSADLYFPVFYSVNDFSGANNILPAYFESWLVTKSDNPPTWSFISFDSDITENHEIFVNPSPMDSTFFNISSFAGTDTHPQFFSIYDYLPGYQTVFLFWESWRNNHWQIWMSHNDTPLGIGNKDRSGISRLFCYPNPVHSSMTIRYIIQEPSETSIELYDLYGKKIKDLFHGFSPTGSYSLTWDGLNDSGKVVCPGVYICIMKNPEGTFCQMVVVNQHGN